MMEAEMIPTVYPTDLFTARRNLILEAYRRLTPQQQRNVIAELAEMAACAPDKVEGSDTSLSGSLSDAGFGSGGVL
jgi:hypothetical protein